MNEPKKLYRTEHGAAMLAGVCGGVSEYFNLDPSVVRLVWAALCCLWGTGVVLYLVAAVVLPKKSQVYPGY
ncbi:PspC domain-containing protein [uncultured Intestinimonas sp.]|uniref:PspC domain-containing protein n=1 Tax=uncultured Intestinimonas sp. TaxID=1689265 RepID=UPI0025E09BB3|nr:PspC domain-containing protein [uncultured Intestinimonas sp.]